MHRTRTAYLYPECRATRSCFYFRIGTVITFSRYAKASKEEKFHRFFIDRHCLSFTIDPAGPVKIEPRICNNAYDDFSPHAYIKIPDERGVHPLHWVAHAIRKMYTILVVARPGLRTTSLLI